MCAEVVSRAKLAEDYKSLFQDKFPSEQLDKAVESITGDTQSYSANGSVASAVVWLKFMVFVTASGVTDKTFQGHAWGTASPGGGVLIGDVYTSDLNSLYAYTVKFIYVATNVYLSMYFYDDDNNYLGMFQAGAISTVDSTGSGTGTWPY